MSRFASAPRLLWTINAVDPASPDGEWGDGDALVEHKLPCEGEHAPAILYLVTGGARALERAVIEADYTFVGREGDDRVAVASWLQRWPDAVLLIAPVDGDFAEAELPCIGPDAEKDVCTRTNQPHEPHELELLGLKILGRFVGPFPAREDGSLVPDREEA